MNQQIELNRATEFNKGDFVMYNGVIGHVTKVTRHPGHTHTHVTVVWQGDVEVQYRLIDMLDSEIYKI